MDPSNPDGYGKETVRPPASRSLIDVHTVERGVNLNDGTTFGIHPTAPPEPEIQTLSKARSEEITKYPEDPPSYNSVMAADSQTWRSSVPNPRLPYPMASGPVPNPPYPTKPAVSPPYPTQPSPNMGFGFVVPQTTSQVPAPGLHVNPMDFAPTITTEPKPCGPIYPNEYPNEYPNVTNAQQPIGPAVQSWAPLQNTNNYGNSHQYPTHYQFAEPPKTTQRNNDDSCCDMETIGCLVVCCECMRCFVELLTLFKDCK